MSSFVEIQPNEPEDNLVRWNPKPRRCVTREELEAEGNILQRYNKYVESRRAMGVTLDCRHQYGLAHFWNNPEMEPPCRIVKIYDQWYLRKSCAHIGKVIRLENGWFEFEGEV